MKRLTLCTTPAAHSQVPSFAPEAWTDNAAQNGGPFTDGELIGRIVMDRERPGSPRAGPAGYFFLWGPHG